MKRKFLSGDGSFRNDSRDIVEILYDKAQRKFENFLIHFLRAINPPNFKFPFPPMMGNGKKVDLCKLFLVVKGKGGYDAVCNQKLWNLAGEESGCGDSVGSTVKLFYLKYLSALDAWMEKNVDRKEVINLECKMDTYGVFLMDCTAQAEKLIFDRAPNEVAGEELKREGYDDECKN